MTNNTSAYFNGTQNCGQGKISLNGLNKQNSLNDVDKSNRFSGRRKKEKKLKHSKSSDSQHQHMLDNSRIIGMKLAEGNYVVPNGRVVQNGNITYRNIMKDSASENEDVEHVPRSLSRNGSRSFREHSGSESVRNSAINIRPSFHSSGTLSNGCHGNTSPSYRGFDGDYETIGNMDTVSRKYEAFVARLRAETETSSKKLSNPQYTLIVNARFQSSKHKSTQ
ncbi:hypothetical protein DPMN_063193 [Dreissena polymorpha]|uniref:Uncharacterized protein n=1 Tax=Dreissena polymorpha TaxID=45954 RepID=A0A9D4CA20_DREPO|nr:hypothetical protein DPMN_063193 [Dreissena polymorpha]